jgi:hypothetical protein
MNIKQINGQHVVLSDKGVVMFKGTSPARCRQWLRECWEGQPDATVKAYTEPF